MAGNYKRFISYLHKYEHGEKGENVGFVKVEVRMDDCRFYLQLRDRAHMDEGLYSIYVFAVNENNIPMGKLVDQIKISNGTGEYKYNTSQRDVFHSGMGIDRLDGVMIRKEAELFYATQWTEKEMRTDAFLSAEEADNEVVTKGKEAEETDETPAEGEAAVAVAVATAEEEAAVAVAVAVAIEAELLTEDEAAGHIEKGIREGTQEQAVTAAVTQEEKQQTKDALFQEKPSKEMEALLRILEDYPKLPVFDNGEIFGCVRIEPNDIGRLDMKYWRLGTNSFLSHGYYQYQYLMLGKMHFQDGKTGYILGVPGVYNNKEKYLADIFGFDQFVPVKMSRLKTGQFGYWIVELK